MIATSTGVPTVPNQPLNFRPLPICRAPRPSEAAEPNSVAKMARMSMSLPIGPSVLDPSSGAKAARDQLRAALAEGAVGDGDAHDGVDRPRVQGPVEQRGGHGGLRWPAGSAAFTGSRRRADVVEQRLGHAVEHQADAHAGAEHHRHPRDRLELGLLVVACRAGSCRSGSRPARGRRRRSSEASSTNSQPVLVMTQSRAPVEAVFEAGRAEEAPEDERDGDDRGDPEDHLVHAAARFVGARVDRRQGQRLQQLVGVVGVWCGRRGGLAPGGAVGRVVGRRRRLAGGVDVGGQGTPFRFGSAEQGRRAGVVRGGQHEGGGSATGPRRYGGSRPSAQPPTVVDDGCADQTGSVPPVLRARRTSRRGG